MLANCSVCLQHLLNVKSLKYLSNLTLPDRITKSLLHLHKKKKPPSISAQFQVSHTGTLKNADANSDNNEPVSCTEEFSLQLGMQSKLGVNFTAQQAVGWLSLPSSTVCLNGVC